MHRYVRMIFNDHDHWLRDGGNQSITVVQQANLASFIDKYLVSAVSDGYSGAIDWMLNDPTLGLTSEQVRRLASVRAQSRTEVVHNALHATGEKTPARVANEPPNEGNQQQDDEREVAVGPAEPKDERGGKDDPKPKVQRGVKH